MEELLTTGWEYEETFTISQSSTRSSAYRIVDISLRQLGTDDKSEFFLDIPIFLVKLSLPS